MSPADMTATLMALKRKILAEQRRHNVERELDLLREGEAFLEEHPSSERVAALLDPALAEEEIPEDEAVALRRHLALCATCAEEARWLRGEEAAGRDGAVPARTGGSPYRRVAVAASVVLAFLLGAGSFLCFWILNLLVSERKGVRRLEEKVDELFTVLAAILTEKQILIDTPLLDRYIAEANLHEEANNADPANEVQHASSQER